MKISHYLRHFIFQGGAEEGDDEPDKMAIAFNRIGRFKRWIKQSIGNFFRGIKNGIVRAIRGPRGGTGSGSGGPDIIALEVTDEKDFQVNTLPIEFLTEQNNTDDLQGENGDLKNRSGLKVDINHLPLGGKVTGNSTNNSAGDNFPDSSIGEGMDITIQGANGHVKNQDNQSLKSYDSKRGNGNINRFLECISNLEFCNSLYRQCQRQCLSQWQWWQ